MITSFGPIQFPTVASTPIYPNNAATPGAGEVNGTAGWTSQGSNEVDIQSVTDPQEGTYAIQLTVNHGQTNVDTKAFLELDNIELGEDYTITMQCKRVSGSFNMRPILRASDGWVSEVTGDLVTTETYSELSVSGTTDTGPVLIEFRFTTSSDDGHRYFVDNIVVTKTS